MCKFCVFVHKGPPVWWQIWRHYMCVLSVYCLPFFPVYSVGIVIMLLLFGGLNPRTIVLNPPGGTSSHCQYFSWLKWTPLPIDFKSSPLRGWGYSEGSFSNIGNTLCNHWLSHTRCVAGHMINNSAHMLYIGKGPDGDSCVLLSRIE